MSLETTIDRLRANADNLNNAEARLDYLLRQLRGPDAPQPQSDKDNPVWDGLLPTAELWNEEIDNSTRRLHNRLSELEALLVNAEGKPDAVG